LKTWILSHFQTDIFVSNAHALPNMTLFMILFKSTHLACEIEGPHFYHSQMIHIQFPSHK